MLLVLLAKIIKTGWFDSDEEKNQDQREMASMIINKLIKVVSTILRKIKLEIIIWFFKGKF